MTSSVDGLVSGMDTTTIISQLMQLEKQSQTRLVQKQADYQTKVKAYQTINTKMASLQSAADKLTKPETWQAFRATSSTSSVSVTASTKAQSGSWSFDVLALAEAHSAISTDSWTSTAARITSAPTFTITKADGSPVMTVDAGDGSLATVVANINAKGGGVKAAAVQVSPNTYRLSLTSTTTGASSSFTTDLVALDPAVVVGADAKIGMGTPSGTPATYPVEITSASNTFTDVLPGVTFTVSKVESARIDVVADADGLGDKVQAMVTAANAALAEIDKQTAYDPSTKQTSTLTGDSTVRSLQQRLLNTISQAMGGKSPATVGIQLTKDGRVDFDKAKFVEAYAADPSGTAAMFKPTGTITHPTLTTQPQSVSLVYAGDQTKPGSYDVVVSRAALQATVTLQGSITAGDAFTIGEPGKTPVVVTAASTDPAALATALNDASAANSLGLVASVESGAVVVRQAQYGTGVGFSLTTASATATPTYASARIDGAIAGTESIDITVPSMSTLTVAAAPGDTAITLADRINTAMAGAGLGMVANVKAGAVIIEAAPGGPSSVAVSITGGTLQSYATGTDVAGTIGGVASTGTGQVLAAPTDDPTLYGLSFRVTTTTADVAAAAAPPNNGLYGTFAYAPGLAQRLDSFAGDAIRSGTGSLTTVIEGSQQAIDDLDKQIAAWDTRLTLKEATLRRQFSGLETALGKLRDQSNWLAGQLGSLPSASS